MKKSCDSLLTLPDDAIIYSFDVFDTALARRWARPHDLFHFLETELVKIDGRWTGFAEKRIAAEFDLRQSRQFAAEVTLAEIYALLATSLDVPGDEAEMAMNLELREEEQSLLANLDIKRLITILRGKGKRVVFISDIYLPKEFVASRLLSLDLMQEGDGLYVSSETGVMKATGALFDHVLKTEKCGRDDMVHVGDSREWDVLMPQKQGIRAYCYERTKMTRYEENIQNSELLDRSSRSLLAGALRNARLRCPYDDEARRTIWDVTANVSGPLMIGYVKWCLDQAVERKLNRLYFLSRDGQILLKLAEVLKKKLGYEIELKYLHVSRQALLFPAINTISDEELEWILAPTSFLSLRLVFRRMNFELDEFEPILDEYGFDHSRYDCQLSQQDRDTLKRLLRDPRSEKLILGKADCFRAQVIGYLRQEGVTADGNFAVVDIGWNGTLQRSLSRILERYGYNFPTKGFYFGLRRKLKHRESDELYGYFSEAGSPARLESYVYIIPMVELFTAADHGVVLRYWRTDGGGYLPELKSKDNSPGIEWGVLVQQEAMLNLAQIMLNELIECYVSQGSYQMVCEKNFADFILTPAYAEAEVYGSYPFHEEQNDSYSRKLANKFSLTELIKYRFGRFKYHHHDEWVQGAIALSSPIGKKIIGIDNGQSFVPEPL